MEINRIFLILLHFLFLSAKFGSSNNLGSENSDSECSSRCNRLLSRSLAKINYSIKKVDGLLKSNQKVKDLGDVCWKFYDYYDCEKQCEKKSKKSLSRLDVLTRLVVKRCKFVDEGGSECYFEIWTNPSTGCNFKKYCFSKFQRAYFFQNFQKNFVCRL